MNLPAVEIQRPLLAHTLLCIASLFCLFDSASADEVDFARDIQPIFAKNCVACHSRSKAEGGLDLESHMSLMRGGDSGASIEPGNAGESYLMTRVIGEDDEIMPPEENEVGAARLTANEMKLLRQWIAQGAKDTDPDGSVTSPLTMSWSPLPKTLKPTYSLAVASDGQFLAFGSGNSLKVTATPGSPFENFVHPEVLLDPELETATHRDLVHSVAISGDSRKIATGGFRSVKIWRKTHPSRSIMDGIPKETESMCFNSNRSRLACVVGNLISVFNLKSSTTTQVESTLPADVLAIAWTKPVKDADSSSTVIVCDQDGNWQLIDLETASHTPLKLDVELTSKRILPVGESSVLVLDSNGSLFHIKWELAPEPAVSLERFDEIETVLDFVTFGKSAEQVALLLQDGVVVIADIATREERKRFSTEKAYDRIRCDTNGKRFLLSGSDALDLWDPDSPQPIASLQVDYLEQSAEQALTRLVHRHTNALKSLTDQQPQIETELKSEKTAEEERTKAKKEAEIKLAEVKKQLKDAEKALSQSESKLEQLKNDSQKPEKSENQIAEVEKKLSDQRKAVDEAEKKVREASEALELKQRSLATAIANVKRVEAKLETHQTLVQTAQEKLHSMEQQHAQLKAEHQESVAITGVVFTSDNRIVIAGRDGILRVFSHNGVPIANISVGESIRALDLYSDSLATVVTQTGRVMEFDLITTWELERTIGSVTASPFSDRITSLDFSPDGSRLAVGSGFPSRSGELTLIDLSSGNANALNKSLHQDAVFSVAFSPDGKFLLTAAADKQCHLVDVKNVQVLRTFEGHTHHVLSVAWHDSGDQMATASADGTIKVWDVQTGQQKRTIKGFDVDVTSLTYVGASPQLLTATVAGDIHLYDSDNGKRVRSYSGFDGPAFTVGVSPGGSHVFAAGQLGFVNCWQLKDAKSIPVQQHDTK